MPYIFFGKDSTQQLTNEDYPQLCRDFGTIPGDGKCKRTACGENDPKNKIGLKMAKPLIARIHI